MHHKTTPVRITVAPLRSRPVAIDACHKVANRKLRHKPKRRLEDPSRLSDVDDQTLPYLAEELRMPVQELFPPRTPGNRIDDFIEKLKPRF